MNSYTVCFELLGHVCELDFRSTARHHGGYIDGDAADIGRKIIASIPQAMFLHVKEKE